MTEDFKIDKNLLSEFKALRGKYYLTLPGIVFFLAAPSMITFLEDFKKSSALGVCKTPEVALSYSPLTPTKEIVVLKTQTVTQVEKIPQVEFRYLSAPGTIKIVDGDAKESEVYTKAKILKNTAWKDTAYVTDGFNDYNCLIRCDSVIYKVKYWNKKDDHGRLVFWEWRSGKFHLTSSYEIMFESP